MHHVSVMIPAGFEFRRSKENYLLKIVGFMTLYRVSVFILDMDSAGAVLPATPRATWLSHMKTVVKLSH